MNSNQQIAAGITFLICIYLLIMLLVLKLSWNPTPDALQQPPYVALEAEEEEFIEVEVETPVADIDDASLAQTSEDVDNQSQLAPLTGNDLSTQGKPGTPAQNVTQKQESTAKERQRATTDEKAAAVENARQQQEKATSQRTQNTVSNAFANAGNRNNTVSGKRDEGPSGSTAGNPAGAGTKTGEGTGTVGGGWKIPAYSKAIPSNEVGSVTFEVVVNADGSVGKITPISNSGLTSATIAKCRAEIQRHRFTHPNISAAEATTARITFTFRDPK